MYEHYYLFECREETYVTIPINLVMRITNRIISKEQCGFRTMRGCIDKDFALGSGGGGARRIGHFWIWRKHIIEV